jgi:Tfp pilus assembly protein FimT
MRTVRLIALLALAALPGLMGCTHTQQVSRTATAAPSDEQTGRWKAVREIKEASREHAVTVVTLGGRNYRARSVQLQADTLSWLSPDEEVVRRVPYAACTRWSGRATGATRWRVRFRDCYSAWRGELLWRRLFCSWVSTCKVEQV